MGAQFGSLSLFLLVLLTFQEMMQSEAVLCEAPSRLFKGVCIRDKKCLAVCEQDGFISGECKDLKCVCAKDCNSVEEEEESSAILAEEMMMTESKKEKAGCYVPNKLMKRCFRDKKCSTSCVNQGFLSGECKRFKCVCAKDDCNSGGDEDEPPVQGGEESPPEESSAILAEEEMMMMMESKKAKAAGCYVPNKLMKRCFRDKKCSTSCVNQGFLSGKCKRFKCVCANKCDSPPPNDDYEVPVEGPSDGGDEELML